MNKYMVKVQGGSILIDHKSIKISTLFIVFSKVVNTLCICGLFHKRSIGTVF
jgi:hypothetical protein